MTMCLDQGLEDSLISEHLADLLLNSLTVSLWNKVGPLSYHYFWQGFYLMVDVGKLVNQLCQLLPLHGLNPFFQQIYAI